MYIKVHVIPKAKRERVVKENETVYYISVKEPAERNLANHRVRELLMDIYGLDKGKVRMISGHRSPTKVFDIEVNK